MIEKRTDSNIGSKERHATHEHNFRDLEDRSPQAAKTRKPVLSVSEDSSEADAKQRYARRVKRTKAQDEFEDSRENKNRRSSRTNSGWGDYPNDIPDFDQSNESEDVEKQLTRRRTKVKAKDDTPAPTFTPQGSPVLGTFSRPRGNAAVEDLKGGDIFTGEWTRSILDSNPHFSWQNAMFGLHRNYVRNKNNIQPKDMIRCGDLSKKLKLAASTLVKIANAFVLSTPPYLVCIDSKKAVYKPTAAMTKLTIDDNWQYKERSVEFEIQSVRFNEENNAEYIIKGPAGEILHMTINMILTHPEYALELREALAQYEENQRERKRKADAAPAGEPSSKVQKLDEMEPDQPSVVENTTALDTADTNLHQSGDVQE